MKEFFETLYRENVREIIALVLAGVIIILPISPVFAHDLAKAPPVISAPAEI